MPSRAGTGGEMNSDKVRSFFLGTAIGDVLGMPVEGQAHERIKLPHRA